MKTLKSVDVVLVDDHEVVREGVKIGLRAPYRVVADVGDGASAIRVVHDLQPAVALVDMRLPDISGPELCSRIRAVAPRTRVVMLSSYFEEGAVRSALRAGASHYVSKVAGIAELQRTLEEVLADDTAAPPRDAHRIVTGRVDDGGAGIPRNVTPQEEKVLELAAQGFTDREIGHRLFLAESTVRFHLQRLKVLLGAQTKTEVVAKAIRTGILPPVAEG